MLRDNVRTWIATTFEGRASVIMDFPVLHHEWDGDGYGWIVTVGDEKKLILTDHGSPYVAEPDELEERLLYYHNVVAATKVAQQVLKLK